MVETGTDTLNETGYSATVRVSFFSELSTNVNPERGNLRSVVGRFYETELATLSFAPLPGVSRPDRVST